MWDGRPFNFAQVRLSPDNLVRLPTQWLEVGLAVVVLVIMITIVVVIAPVAALANFFQMAAALLSLGAALAVLADGSFHILLCLVDIAAALVITVIPVGAGGRRHCGQ
jgi:hypothetical protein